MLPRAVTANGSLFLGDALPWVVFSTAVVIGCLVAHYQPGIFKYVVYVAGPFLAGRWLRLQKRGSRYVATGIAVATCLVAVMAVIEFVSRRYLYGSFPGASALVRGGLLRTRASFEHPLGLGMFLCLGVFFVADLLRERSTLRLVALAVVAMGIFSTVSRSPLGGLVAGAIVFTLATARQGRGRSLGVAAGVVVLAVVLFMPGGQGRSYRDFMLASTTHGTVAARNVQGRQSLLVAGIDAAVQKPLFGWGFGSTWPGTSTVVAQRGRTFQDVANLPLAILIETGFAGFLAIFAVATMSMVRMYRAGDSTSVAALAGCAGALVTSLGVTLPSVVAPLMLVLGAFPPVEPDDRGSAR